MYLIAVHTDWEIEGKNWSHIKQQLLISGQERQLLSLQPNGQGKSATDT